MALPSLRGESDDFPPGDDGPADPQNAPCQSDDRRTHNKQCGRDTSRQRTARGMQNDVFIEITDEKLIRNIQSRSEARVEHSPAADDRVAQFQLLANACLWKDE